jgi:hypothetical protein
MHAMNASEQDFIYLFQDQNGRRKQLTDTISRTALREFVKQLPEKEALGLRANEIGNRTLRSSAAMAMNLNDASDSDIMLHGRWKSNAFLDYIRPQTNAFAAAMSARMIGAPAVMFSTTNTNTFDLQYTNSRSENQNSQNNQMFRITETNLENLLGPMGQSGFGLANITATW